MTVDHSLRQPFLAMKHVHIGDSMRWPLFGPLTETSNDTGRPRSSATTTNIARLTRSGPRRVLRESHRLPRAAGAAGAEEEHDGVDLGAGTESHIISIVCVCAARKQCQVCYLLIRNAREDPSNTLSLRPRACPGSRPGPASPWANPCETPLPSPSPVVFPACF